MSQTLKLRGNTTTRNHCGLSSALLWAFGLRALIVGVGIWSVWLGVKTGFEFANASGIPWLAWDGMHYVEIMREGYAADRSQNHFHNIAFFPLLPSLASLLTFALKPEVALVLVGNICSLAGFAVFYLWVRNLGGTRIAFVATLLLATHPGAVFYSAGMTEGPFLLIVAITLYLLQKQLLWPAALVCAVGTLTRPTGVALAATVALVALVGAVHMRWPKRLAFSILIGLVASSGAIAYEAFLWNRYGKADVYLEAQHNWVVTDQLMHAKAAAQPGPRRFSPGFFLDRATKPQGWNYAMAVGVFVVTTIGFFRPGNVPRALFALPMLIFLMTVLPNLGLRASSVIRYETAGLPMFALLAIWLDHPHCRRWLLPAVLFLGFAAQLYYAVLYNRGIWVG